MKKFHYKQYHREYPARWNELTTEQLLFVCKLLNLNLKRALFNIAVLRNFLQLPKSVLYSVHPIDLAYMGDSISYLLESSTLTFQKLPTVKVFRWFKFVGPESALTNVTFEQFFEYAETFYAQYMSTGNEQNLNMLVASLYRRPDTSFHTEAVETNAQMLSNFLIKKFPLTFSGSGESSAQPDGLEFTRLLTMIVKSPSENASVRKLNLYEALVYIENQIEIANKSKK